MSKLERIEAVELMKGLDYVAIEASYGGNQQWFRDELFGNGDAIYLGGCGLIAMADLILYLAQEEPQLLSDWQSVVSVNRLTSQTYQLFVESLFYSYLEPWRNPLFNPNHYEEASQFVLGIQGWQLKRGLNRFLRDHNSKDEAVSFVSLRRQQSELTSLICQQLRLDRPVPLLIGPTKTMFPKILSFLGRSSPVKAQKLSKGRGGQKMPAVSAETVLLTAHWVTVTGYFVVPTTGNEFVTIASWGEKYLLDFTAYKNECDWISGVVLISKRQK